MGLDGFIHLFAKKASVIKFFIPLVLPSKLNMMLLS